MRRIGALRSLSAKLTLAFLLTSLAGVALAAVLTRQFVTSEFDQYVVAQRQAAFIDRARTFYVQRGGWGGVTPQDLAGGWPASTDTQRLPDVPSGSGPYQVRVDFILVDAQGNVLVPNGIGPRKLLLTGSDIGRGAPVVVAGKTVGLVITPDRAPFRDIGERRYLARTDAALAVAGGIVVLIALALGLLLARLITRPIRDLTAAAAAISDGNLEQRVAVRSRDEIGALAAQFNQMSAALARANQLRRQMTADIAHDLRTPLTVVNGYLEALSEEVLQPTPQRFQAMYDETRVLLRLVEDLHTLSLADAGELNLSRQPVDPQALLDRTAATYYDAADQRQIQLEVSGSPATPPILVDVEQISRVLGNLVANALRYTPAGGRVTLAAGPGEGGVALTVADTGEGIPAEHLPNIFERFYRIDTARQPHGGSGLGLAIVKSIVEAHGGSVRVASNPRAGTTFTIVLPAAGS